MSGAVDSMRSAVRWFAVDGPPSYRDAWRLAAGVSIVGLVFAAVQTLAGSPDVGAFLGSTGLLVGVAFTLGVAVAHREWRHAGLSAALGVAWAVVVGLIGPVRGAVAELPWLDVFAGWLVVLFALLGYATPEFARHHGE